MSVTASSTNAPAPAAGQAAPDPRARGVVRLLPPAERHLVSRFSYGITPELARRVRAAGGAARWFEQQLSPGSVRDPQADAVAGWFPSLRRGPAELWRRQVQDVEGGWEVMEDYARWLLVRRTRTRRPVLEMMTELWENLLHVPASGDEQFTHRVDYGATIRRHALGRYDELLVAAITHPAMLIHLDAAESTKEHPNENLGRELLELHTVGVGQYTEDDVRDSARILTGWSVDLWESWRPEYHREEHHVGRVRVKGFVDANRSDDGRAVTRRYLRYLAHHPQTARRVAQRLAVKFVGDRPPASLVDRLARVYLEHDTAIKPVLRALVASSAFARSAGAKVRDPGEDVVATYRVLGKSISRPPSGEARGRSAAEAILWQASSIGTSPYAWPAPDGQPIDSASWSSPSRLLASMRFHLDLAGGWWPDVAVGHREPRQWLPRPEVRFDDLVDHVSRLVLHRPASDRLVEACSRATGVGRRERVDAEHPLVQWMFPTFLAVFLDSPAHLSR
ncbi:DUF1800 domain-containing protein [Nocardioides dongxiaopingii]|nr:DUF1800 domain-containing protein [Nocardioides sp. S-1144]